MGMIKHLDRAHLKINYHFAVIEVLLISVYKTVFMVLQWHTLPVDILQYRISGYSCVSSLTPFSCDTLFKILVFAVSNLKA